MTRRITFLLSNEEKEACEAMARNANMAVRDYVLQLVQKAAAAQGLLEAKSGWTIDERVTELEQRVTKLENKEG